MDINVNYSFWSIILSYKNFVFGYFNHWFSGTDFNKFSASTLKSWDLSKELSSEEDKDAIDKARNILIIFEIPNLLATYKHLFADSSAS